MIDKRFHIGFRAVKTGLAVSLALLFAQLHSADLPVFAAIGAIVGMSRTPYDTRRTFMTQVVGIICGCLLGCLLVAFLPQPNVWIIGLGTIVLIALCNLLRAQYAAYLSCITFICVCLFTGSDPILYFIWRLIDTLAGILIALIINIIIKPYNNREAVIVNINGVLDAILPCVNDCILHGQYPDLTPLKTALAALDTEIMIFGQPVVLHRKRHAQETAYLSGCQQLVERMAAEITAICTMDTFGIPDENNCRRLEDLGLTIDQTLFISRICTEADTAVFNYHLEKLLNSYDYLSEMLEGENY